MYMYYVHVCNNYVKGFFVSLIVSVSLYSVHNKLLLLW